MALRKILSLSFSNEEMLWFWNSILFLVSCDDLFIQGHWILATFTLPRMTTQDEMEVMIAESFSGVYSSWPNKWLGQVMAVGLPVCLRDTTAFISGSSLLIYSLLHSKFIWCLLETVQNNIKCLYFKIQAKWLKSCLGC